MLIFSVFLTVIENINKQRMKYSIFRISEIHQIKVLKQKSVDSPCTVWYNFQWRKKLRKCSAEYYAGGRRNEEDKR